MKLRQKLAAVLAATMVVTAVPVTTMAASSAYTQKVQQQEKDGKFDATLVIELKDKVTTSEIFYLHLEGAEFNKFSDLKDDEKISEYDDVTFKRTAADEATVEVKVAKEGGKKLYIPIKDVKLTADEAKVNIIGGDVITNDTVVIAKKIDAKSTVTAADAKNIFDGGKVAEITIDEPTFKALQDKDGKYPEITLELENSDFEFVINNKGDDKTEVAGSRGLAGVKATIELKNDDKGIAKINITEVTPTGAGKLVIKNLSVVAKNRVTPSLGDVEVTVKGDKVTEKTVKVAEVKDFGSEFKVTKEETITAGKDKEVEVTLKEVVKSETFLKGKKVEFTLENGFFVEQLNDVDSKELTDLRYFDEDGKELFKDGSDKLYYHDDTAKKQVKDKAVTVTALMGTESEVKFKAKVGTKISSTEDVVLNVEGRAIEKAKEVKVATVKAPFTVTSEKAIVKAGLKGQKAGKVVITEAEKGQLDDLTLKVDAKETGITFSDEPTVTGTNVSLGKAKDDTTTSGQYKVTIPVKRSSKEAATVEIKDVPVNVTRMAPEGSWDLKVGVEGYYGELEVKDFFTVGTPNIEDLASNGLRKGATSFVINSTKCVVNGVEKELDAAPYVSAKGRTMVPVRALADAFGVDAKDIMFSNGTIVIIAGNKTVQLTNGSDIANVNGVAIKMGEKVTIKNNRTYAPASQIGNLLGVEPAWDQATQTATFTNK